DNLSQLPAQVHRILDADVQTLPANWSVHVCRVSRDQHAPAAIRDRLTRHVGKARDPARAVHAVVLAVNPDERVADVLQGGLIGAFQIGHDEGDAHPSFFGRTDATTTTQAEFRLLLHLDLGNDP